MKFVINDLTVKLLVSALAPGEQLVGKVMGRSQPWYTSFLKFDVFMPYYLFLATNQRLLVLEHKKKLFGAGYEITSVDALPWSDVEQLDAKGLTKGKLVFAGRTQYGAKRLTVKIPTFMAPLRGNGKETKALVGAFTAGRSLPPGAATGPMLPYGAPASRPFA